MVMFIKKILGMGNSSDNAAGSAQATAPATSQAPASSCGCAGSCEPGQGDAAGSAHVDGGAVIKVLGACCAKCGKLEANVHEALKQLGSSEEVEHVSDMAQIVSWGVMSTPGLVVDGKVVSTGRLLSVEQVKEILQARQS